MPKSVESLVSLAVAMSRPTLQRERLTPKQAARESVYAHAWTRDAREYWIQEILPLVEKAIAEDNGEEECPPEPEERYRFCWKA